MAQQVKPYRWMAQYYDDLFAGFRDPMDEARDRLLRRILPEVKTACDLACGTGLTALSLARRGIKMYGVDLSPGMCRVTREKAVRAGVPIRVFEADMRDFRLPEPVDLVLCEYDALNHVPRKADLRNVARAVARALRPGGHFFFDVNNSLGFRRYWNSNVWFEKDGMVVVMRNGHNDAADRAWSDIDWFVREGHVWRRHSERVEEVCWTRSEMTSTLQQAGFDRVRAWDAAPYFGAGSLIRSRCRTIYLARRAQRRGVGK